ncbi:right-handed parallel beta-helix repeat-containing protein [Yeosuana marina]|uniref:right-handed parallel beta-helix repeat-containing protein n=1 Tax=Yeosuana marina TaxID=1565536 RepID=UPI0030EEAC8F|tara:strand:- start:2 stop:1993 length:1992 start_codon:yes stop_codon:yes gene_type:complete
MTSILKPMFFIFLVTISIVSCNNEELFVAPEAETPVETTTPSDSTSTDTPTPPEDTVDPVVNTSTPCDFDLSTASSGDTIIINCLMDLQGQTLNLPPNVTILYEGGDITNGTLNFSDNSVISGELLNSSVTLTGSIPQLKESIFNFDPQRWGIVEGITTSDIAQRNNNILENLMFSVKDMGVNIFKIDKMDAYFEVSKVTSTTTNQNYYPSVEAINMPSDFSLVMTDNTYLRVQPNAENDYVLLAVRDASNVKIEGGNLYGDRDKHDDSQTTGNSGHVIMIHGGDNVDINGVRMVNGTGDGIDINSLNFTFQPNYIPSNNIRITNCTFDNNRRNNMSITDGFNILVDGNTFLNGGADNPNSVGVRPGYAIDVEAVRGKENGEYIYYEKAYDITISNNIERGSKHGAFIVAIGEKTTIINNTTENGISIGDASEVKIIGNTISRPTSTNGTGIVTGHPDSLTTFDNVVSGNTISGFNTGIAVYQRDTEIFDNTITDFAIGILPKSSKNINIYKNNLSSERPSSYGIFANVTSLDNFNIYENKITKVDRESINIVMVNTSAESVNNVINIKNNLLYDNKVTLERCNGINFTGNDSEYLSLVDIDRVSVSDNVIHSNSNHGIEIMDGCSNLTVTNNDISVPASRQCVYQKSTDGININISGNTCNN